MTTMDAPALLRRMMAAAIAAADPATVLAGRLPEKPKGRCIVVGAGKSAAAMARAVETAWPDVDLSGVPILASREAGIQPKLTIGARNDAYEQQADDVAGRVMRQAEGGASEEEEKEG